ncbi:hypothetical protein EXN65_17440 [Clostridium botulinum]|uniref:Uncharacterized protein n=2 Tax=Clostridium botulinum TaxID=1491 RepID=A0A846I695_CLOBO|nr:hypothetical protein CLJ_B0627 [Clostridium botulinum Ba4 str. 657]AUN02200.1 hypothetical protein RSJ19_04425 [Clostridium botulinum]EPS52673.1 hypothetical protein CFSAN002368_05603 [Clostridium botulinum A1 str. CFSAN002368]AXG92214.1 hypothetical protein AGE29_10650 [Clostridium botulinum]MBN3397936.1 hypothetical protein [Clostridium botulinum]
MKGNILEIMAYIFTFIAIILSNYMQKFMMENKEKI